MGERDRDLTDSQSFLQTVRDPGYGIVKDLPKIKIRPSTPSFFFRHILEKDISDISDAARAKRKSRLPVVLAKLEVETQFYIFVPDKIHHNML